MEKYHDFFNANATIQRDTLIVSYRKFSEGLFKTCVIIAVLSAFLSAFSIYKQVIENVSSLDVTCVFFSLLFFLIAYHIANRIVALEYLAKKLYGEGVFEDASLSDYLDDLD